MGKNHLQSYLIHPNSNIIHFKEEKIKIMSSEKNIGVKYVVKNSEK